MSLDQLKVKYEKYINQDDVDTIKSKLSNQDNMCYICCGDLEDDVIIKTKCGHFYHYNCLKMSIINGAKSYYNKQECPYCRSNTGWLPLIDNTPIKNVHLEYNSNIQNNYVCKAILKSGKKKGQICGCRGNPLFENKCCGRHKNYVFPKIEESDLEEIEKFKKNWYKDKILNCY